MASRCSTVDCSTCAATRSACLTAHRHREYIVHPGAVAIVPLTDDDRLVMERQYRYPVGQVPGVSCRASSIQARVDPGVRPANWPRKPVIARASGPERALLHNAPALCRGSSSCGSLAGWSPPRSLDEGSSSMSPSFRSTNSAGPPAGGEVTDAKTLIALLWLPVGAQAGVATRPL